MYPSVLPRRCSEVPPQLPTLYRGTSIRSQRALICRQKSESRSLRMYVHSRLFWNASGL